MRLRVLSTIKSVISTSSVVAALITVSVVVIRDAIRVVKFVALLVIRRTLVAVAAIEKTSSTVASFVASAVLEQRPTTQGLWTTCPRVLSRDIRKTIRSIVVSWALAISTFVRWKTVASEVVDKINTSTAVETGRVTTANSAIVVISFAVAARPSSCTRASVIALTKIATMASVQAERGIGTDAATASLASQSAEISGTQTLEGIYAIQTSRSVEARIGIAFIDVLFTMSTGESVSTSTLE